MILHILNLVMSLHWNCTALMNWIEKGCDENIVENVIKLDINYHQLTYIPKPIEILQNMTAFYCDDNKLSFLPDSIGELRNLTIFSCNRNKLTSIPEWIGALQNLTIFSCGDNKLVSLPDSMKNLQKLSVLECNNNELVSLPEWIGDLQNLTNFLCGYNKISYIPESFGNLQNLTSFSCNHNQLVSFPISITRLRKLRCIYKENNPIEYTPPNVVRFLENLGNIMMKKTLNVYNDAQSVHNHNIQASIRNSIEYVMYRKPSLTIDQLNEAIVSNDILSESTKRLLFEYSDSTEIHSVLNITFGELLLNVYSLILENKHKDELLKILDVEIQDSECKCFTGRMSRLVNVLNGFVDGVKVEISNGEQIGNVIVLVKQKLERSGEYTLLKHREESERELLERGYESDVIKEWMEYISE